jgi:hypothetical protein
MRPSLFCPVGHLFFVLSPWEIGAIGIPYDCAHIASALPAAPHHLSLSTLLEFESVFSRKAVTEKKNWMKKNSEYHGLDTRKLMPVRRR